MEDKYRTAHLAEELRAEFSTDNFSPLDVFGLAHTIPKLTVALYPFGKNISGMCVIHDRFKLIAVNSGQTYGRQRFTLAHELYHLYYDEHCKASICPTNTTMNDKTERTADTFASYFLIPYLALRNEIKRRAIPEQFHNLSNDELLRAVIEIEQKYSVSRMALLVRLQDEGAITQNQKETLSGHVIAGARKLGFPIALYEPKRGSGAKRADGEYVDLICYLFSQSAISQGKAEELLADGFRDDIWITSVEDGEIVD